MNHVVLRDAATGRWLEFRVPRRVVRVAEGGDVGAALRDVEESVQRHGLHAAGFIAYEAAAAFDAALVTRSAGDFPLLWFGLYDEPRVLDVPPAPGIAPPPVHWAPTVALPAYRRTFDRIKSHIECGDTYQVNYTLRLRAPFDQDPWAFFTHQIVARDPDFGAFVSTGDWAACSASPELFLRLDGELIESRPMKGTIARGRFGAEDRARAVALLASEKDRAENVMIVDMVRNDLGRIARTGTVRVPRLFDIERHATSWQMTSTVQAQTGASVAEIIAAMFPAASITGAPKARSMSIIAENEPSPRRLYTGSIGYIAPGRRAQFNVAIRTVLIDREQQSAEFGVGGGILWDSRAEGEYEECRVKARLLETAAPPFDLMETLLWMPATGYAMLERHLHRLGESAAFFRYSFDADHVRSELRDLSAHLPGVWHRVRVFVAQDGRVRSDAEPLGTPGTARPRRLALAPSPVDSADVFLFHKTTNRGAYLNARRACPGADDVVLCNERGEVTESTIANLVAEIDGELCTPPLECGLLAGVRRAWLLERGLIRERILLVEDVLRSPRVYLVNSLRGMWRVEVERMAPPVDAVSGPIAFVAGDAAR